MHNGRHISIVALEQIIAADPQVIIAMNDRDAQDIRHSPQWQTVDVVRHQSARNVLVVP